MWKTDVLHEKFPGRIISCFDDDVNWPPRLYNMKLLDFLQVHTKSRVYADKLKKLEYLKAKILRYCSKCTKKTSKGGLEEAF